VNEPLQLPPVDELQRYIQALDAQIELAKLHTSASMNLHDFARGAWPIVEPATPYVSTWHIDLIFEYMQRVTRGEITNLVINIPPGCCKSLSCSVLHPAWEWLDMPWFRLQCLSHDHSLVKRDAIKARSIITSGWYKAVKEQVAANGGPPVWELASDQNEIQLYANTATGQRQSLTIGSGVTGAHAHRQSVDDPHDVKDAALGTPDQIEDRMKAVCDTDDQVLSTRVDDIGERKAGRILIGQRVHPNDLFAHRLAEEDVVHLCLPMEYDPDHPHKSPDDPRTTAGELLCPDLIKPDKVEKTKAKLGSQEDAQFRQLPQLGEFAVYRMDWFKQFYQGEPWRLKCDMWDISCDPNLVGGKGNSYWVIQVWGWRGAYRFLLDEWREQCPYDEGKFAFKTMAKKWPQVKLKLIEDKANGHALYNDCKGKIKGVKLYPRGVKDKVTFNQLNGVPPCAAGEVFLPLPQFAPWIEDWRREVCRFPAKPNDRADTMAQLFAHRDEEKNMNALERAKKRGAGLRDL